MQGFSGQHQRWESGPIRVVFTSLAAITAFVAGYVWIVMCLAVLSVLERGGVKDLLHLGVDYTWAFGLDSVCLGLLILLFFLRRDPRLALAGLAIATISFALRLAEAQNPGSMFWFEPYLRSGIYALSFALAYVAYRIRRRGATS